MEDNKCRVSTGKILLAEPFMADGNFKKSVVLLCEHSTDTGTLGFVLNKELDIPLNDLLADFPDIGLNVFYGGPVATDTIHYVHNVGSELDGSVKVSKGIWWGGDFEQLQFKVSSGMIRPENIRFFIGYSGWESGQLDTEMIMGSWVVSKMKKHYLFDTKPKAMWQECMTDKGDTFSILSEVPTGKGVWS
jgi:putative transcriptional regulator